MSTIASALILAASLLPEPTHSAGEPVPAALDLPWSTRADGAAAIDQDLSRREMESYAARAKEVVIGEVVTVRPREGKAKGQIFSLRISSVLRGKRVPDALEVVVPEPMWAGDCGDMPVRACAPVQTPAVAGYEMLWFLDGGRSVLDGTAMYLVEGGFAWRNKRKEVFLRPSAHRVWESEIDPTGDYHVFGLWEARAAVLSPRSRRSVRSRRAQRG